MYIYIYITRSGGASAPTGLGASPGAARSPGAEGRAAASGARSTRRAPPRPTAAARRRARASPVRRGAPVLQEHDRTLELVGSEPVRMRVLDERHASRWNRPVAGGQDVRDRQRVSDNERALLVPGQHDPESTCVALDDHPPALAAARHRIARRRRAGPRTVGLEIPAFVVAVARVVQLEHDEPRDVASGQGQVGGLPSALELARHAQIDL